MSQVKLNFLEIIQEENMHLQNHPPNRVFIEFNKNYFAFDLSKILILLAQICLLIMYKKLSWKHYGIIKVDVLSLYRKSDNYTPQSDNENFTILRGNCNFIKTIK